MGRLFLFRVLVLLVLVLLGVLFTYSIVEASTTADVIITATGIVITPPSGFTASYVSDYEVSLSWVKDPAANNTMVRAAYGHAPTSLTDGYLVYYGVGNSFNDTAVTLASPDIVYYSAWSQRADGTWSPIWASTDTEDLMSASFILLSLILLGGFLTWFSSRVKNILVAFSAGLVWWIIAFWLFFSTTPVLNFSETWSTLLAWAFVMLGFVPFLLHMNVEVQKEIRDKDGNRYTFYEQGDVPKGVPKDTGYLAYRKELRKRLRR